MQMQMAIARPGGMARTGGDGDADADADGNGNGDARR
jgi:hypothetical protein